MARRVVEAAGYLVKPVGRDLLVETVAGAVRLNKATRPLALLAAAERLGRLGELGRLVRARAAAAAAALPGDVRLFVKLHAASVGARSSAWTKSIHGEAPGSATVHPSVSDQAGFSRLKYPSSPGHAQEVARQLGERVALVDHL